MEGKHAFLDYHMLIDWWILFDSLQQQKYIQYILDSIKSITHFHCAPVMCMVQYITYRAFRKYSHSLTYSTFCCVTDWISNWFNWDFVSLAYTQYPIMSKWNYVFRNVYKWFKKKWKAEMCWVNKYSTPLSWQD